MKATRYLFTALSLAVFALSSCHNDDLPGGNPLPEGAVHITAGIEGVQTRAPQLDADGAGTFDPTDTWGMYTFTGDAASPVYSNENIAYQADNSNPLYWENLSETEAVTFSAHYPRITADITDPAAYMYMPQAWNNTDDLLHAAATASKGGTVALTFKHLMHRLVVNLAAGDGMEGADLSSALINSSARDDASTMLANVEVNLLTGAVTYGRATISVILSNGGGPKADWKVAPQDLTAGAEWLRITVGEDVWYYNVPADLNTAAPGNQPRLESGKQLTLNLTLKKNPDTGNTVTLTSGDISGWDTQPSIDDIIDINGNGAPTSGDIDMTNMNADEVKAAIKAALDADHTEIKLTGEFSKTGMGAVDDALGTFFYNTKITKCDLSGVTDWGTPATLPGSAFAGCTALQEVVLPDDVQVIGKEAFFNCTALTTVNLSQVTRIDEGAFRLCTSLAELTLDKVAAIGLDAFFGCTGLKTLKLPACTRFGNYIVTGCKALTRIEAAAAGNFVDINGGNSIENYAVFHNRAAHSGANAFNSAKCDLMLNADKKQDGSAVPKVNNGNEWTFAKGSGYLMQWKSITFPQP
ncbi:leucine-rich repeat protein [Parabacteroides distasonis]|uniref:leucine-rich repeat protein n=1 Tax=Parabacteroides distasonis TaxID=823 RepID=UPI0004D91519|nr:leucine-rich repeat protein [Parabacteroides distasonis]KDS42754.1 leucine rich repeats family protein [Parabacteroides distasonis str. 3776 Po2 i]